MNKLLSFKDVSFIYHSRAAETLTVERLSFGLFRGEFAAIVGPSGCGKTTLLSLCGGLLSPSGGTIERFGSGTYAYMPQKDNLFPWRTVEKNVLLPLEISKNVNEATRAYAESLLEKYGLIEFRDRYPSELSGGMRQRTALIRTLVTSPEVLLLDEPTSSLDYQTRINVCDDLYNIIKGEDKTALLVTHDISEAISLADKIFVLSKRPATLVAEHSLHFPETEPLKKRESAEFPKLFRQIWEEISQ